MLLLSGVQPTPQPILLPEKLGYRFRYTQALALRDFSPVSELERRVTAVIGGRQNSARSV